MENITEKDEDTVFLSEENAEKTEKDNNDTEDNEDAKKGFFKRHKKLVIIIAILAALSAGIFFIGSRRKSAMKNAAHEIKVTVERKDIKNTVSGSSVIEPKDSYNVAAMVTGEITADTFNEGDIVKKDDILYQIDAETVQQSVQTAQNSLKKAQQAYNDALKSQKTNAANNAGAIESATNSLEKAQRGYNDSLESYNDLSISSNISGIVSEVFVKVGDNVQNGTKIASVYSDKYMKLKLPFNEDDADAISVGSGATVTIAGTGDEVWGSVTEIAGSSVTTASHAIVKYVTIELENPGALTINDKATAVINGVASNDVGTFEYIEDGAITAKTSGEIKQLSISENSSVYSGQIIAILESKNMDSSIKDALSAVEDAQLSLEKTVRSSDGSSDTTAVLNAQLSLSDAKIQLEKAQKNLDDYTIKAPIDGTVVTKNKKKGDKLESNSAAASANGTSAMAVIYDLSSLKLQLSVDETEVALVSVGQEVTITADAIEGQTFAGKVTKVGIDGTSSNGVTTYPIDVEITEYGDLLPGMNVTAEIVVEEVKNALAIPTSSLQRGNVVYVKGEKENEDDKAPEGYKSVKVTTGINDDDYIEIKSGLAEGDELKGIEARQGENPIQQMMQGGRMPGGGAPGGGMPGGGTRQGGGAPGGGGGPR